LIAPSGRLSRGRSSAAAAFAAEGKLIGEDKQGPAAMSGLFSAVTAFSIREAC
jgi:hypothetical protein